MSADAFHHTAGPVLLQAQFGPVLIAAIYRVLEEHAKADQPIKGAA